MRVVIVAGALGAVLFLPLGARAAELPSRQAGMWQSSTVVTLADGTKARGGAPVVTVSCVDALTDQKFFTVGGSQCSYLNVTGGGSVFAIDSSCSDMGKPVTVHETLDYVDAGTVEINGTVTEASGPISLSAELKFVGPCMAGMVPGDEGDVENGQFVKTDNVNDPGNQ
jgi:hypothetical protein